MQVKRQVECLLSKALGHEALAVRKRYLVIEEVDS